MRSTNDPIQGLKTKLLDWGIHTEDEFMIIDRECRDEVDREVVAAGNSPVPENSRVVLFKDIYVCIIRVHNNFVLLTRNTAGTWIGAGVGPGQNP